jgi:hypothetical protein
VKKIKDTISYLSHAANENGFFSLSRKTHGGLTLFKRMAISSRNGLSDLFKSVDDQKAKKDCKHHKYLSLYR